MVTDAPGDLQNANHIDWVIKIKPFPICVNSRSFSTTNTDILEAEASIIIEESPLLLVYNSRPGGRSKRGAALHATNHVEAVLVAHKVPSDKGTCTINQRITMDDVFGNHKGPVQEFKQTMEDLSYPMGAPNGGPRCSLPARILQVLVSR